MSFQPTYLRAASSKVGINLVGVETSIPVPARTDVSLYFWQRHLVWKQKHLCSWEVAVGRDCAIGSRACLPNRPYLTTLTPELKANLHSKNNIQTENRFRLI